MIIQKDNEPTGKIVFLLVIIGWSLFCGIYLLLHKPIRETSGLKGIIMFTYMSQRRVFWEWVLKEWKKEGFSDREGVDHLTDLRHAYEKMRDQPIAGAHFTGKLFGDC